MEESKQNNEYEEEAARSLKKIEKEFRSFLPYDFQFVCL